MSGSSAASISSTTSKSSSYSSSVVYVPTAPLPPAKPNHDFTKKPNSMLKIFLWRWRMWFESTFVLSMLEPWEKIMIVTILLITSYFLTSAIVKHLPHHVTVMKRRGMYYLVGQEGDERLLWQLLGWTSSSANAGSSASTAAGLFEEL